MTDATAEPEEVPAKKSKKGLILGFVLALAGGGGGFAVTSGLVPLSPGGGGHAAAASGEVAFLPIDPLTIALADPGQKRYLRFKAELEVDKAHATDVSSLMPRVVDVLNTYLRSVSVTELADPAALLTLRAQMLRRIDLVVGGGKVHDLLVIEFVVS